MNRRGCGLDRLSSISCACRVVNSSRRAGRSQMMACSATVIKSNRDHRSRALRTHLCISQCWDSHSWRDKPASLVWWWVVCLCAQSSTLHWPYGVRDVSFLCGFGGFCCTGICGGVLWLWMGWPTWKEAAAHHSALVPASMMSSTWASHEIVSMKPQTLCLSDVGTPDVCTCLFARCLFCLEPWEELW